MRKSWHGFRELRNKLKEIKLVEREKVRLSGIAMATVELEVKDLDKAVVAVAEVEMRGASAEAIPDPEVSSFEMVLKQHENRLMSIGH